MKSPLAQIKTLNNVMRRVKQAPHLMAVPVVLIVAAVGVRMLFPTRAQIISGYPTTPPAQICGNASILGNGPTTAPAGAVTVPAGDNIQFFTNESYKWPNAAGTVYWFAPGVHTLGTVASNQILTVDNGTYIGAPGAVLDGQHINSFAFEGGHWDGTKTVQVHNVKIEYLTIQNFVPGQSAGAVNQDAGDYWEVAYNTIANNDIGSGMMIGGHNNIHHNCLDSNGQYAFNAYHAGNDITDVIVDHNEIKNNNTYDWEHKVAGCGCTGGGKFWAVKKAQVTNNWVHDNKSVGLWADFNNVEFTIEYNLVENNFSHGIFYEISYNFMIRYNNIRGNDRGEALAPTDAGAFHVNQGEGFPYAAIYISESGGDTRAGNVYTISEIHDNNIENNWDGIALWENADRYCKSPAGGVAATCPFFDQTAGTRQKTQNIKIYNNNFIFDKVAVGCTSSTCGRNGLFSNYGSTPGTVYPGNVIQEAITFNQNNLYSDNNYTGDWNFTAYDQGSAKSWNTWRAAPYNQDAGSTFTGAAGGIAPPPTSPPPATTRGNHLDNDTATLEGSIGKWAGWFSANVSRATDHAQAGTSSLKVDVTAPYGWGVQLNNYPGFAASAGNKTISFWGLNGSGNNNAVMTVHWRSFDGTELQTDKVTITGLNSTWQQAKADVVAPTGTAVVHVDISSNTGAAADVMYFDELYAGERSGTTTPPPTADTTAPSVPSGLSVAATSPTQVNLSWSASSDNIGVTGYEVFRNGTSVGTTTTTSINDTTVSPGSSYSYSVLAYDAANNRSAQSAPVSVTTPQPTDTQKPVFPANALTATAVSSSRIDLRWIAATDNVGVTAYYIVRNGSTIAQVAANFTTYADTTVVAGTAYQYYILAVDAATNSATSNTVAVTTPVAPVADTQAPTVPTTVTATIVTASQVNVTWGASTDNTGVTGYQIRRNGVVIGTTGATSYGDATATAGQSYTYTVDAYDAASNHSAQSTPSNSVTIPSSQATLTGKVTNTSGTVLSGATATLTATGFSRTATTDASGNYSFTGIPNGTYTLAVTKKNYRTSTQSVSLTGGTRTVNISLQRK